jgi:mRNA-degrading endonuclease toxin of MazEF toxin-antitoxin module
MPSIRARAVTDAYRRGDVFWAPDPFREGANPRLWLVLASESLPYAGEEYVVAALTTTDLPANHRVGDDWVSGNDPSKESYCSPWVVATVKHGDIVNPQGRVTDGFADRMAEECKAYL